MKARRNFLKFLVCSGTLGLLRPAAAFHAGSLATPAARRMAALLVDQESARVVGREYLRIYPEEANAGLLLARLCTPAENAAIAIGSYDEERIARIIRRGQQSDLERHRTVNLRGWILSETECRLCALVTVA